MQTYPQSVITTYQEAGLWTADTLATVLPRAAAQWPDRPALTAVDHTGEWVTYTYLQLQERSQQLAARLHAAGIRAGDTVVVALPNRSDFVESIGALFALGAHPVFALPSHRVVELAHFVTATGATALITAGEVAGFDHRELASQVLAATATDLPDLRVFIADVDPGPHQPLYADAAAVTPVADTPALDSTHVGLYQISGGTTGTPKLIPRTHADYLYSVRRSVEICQISPATTMLVALPAAHNFSFSSPGILGMLWAGGHVVLTQDPSPSAVFELIERHRVTITAAVPPLALLWLNMFPRINRDISSLAVLQVGGAKFTPEAARRVGPELGCTLQQVFGMAEGLVNYTELDAPEEIRVGTQGRPMSKWDEILVLDDAGEPVAPGERGVLWTRGPYTIRGYLGGVDAASFSPDGFYCTGDIVRQLPGGYLVVEGRAKDQINRAGEKISAEEIEDHLLSHPQVDDAAVVGVPDATLGELSYAFIVTATPPADAQEHQDLATALRAHLGERGLAAYKIPDRFAFATEFPLTGVGKVSRKALRARIAQTASADI